MLDTGNNTSTCSYLSPSDGKERKSASNFPSESPRQACTINPNSTVSDNVSGDESSLGTKPGNESFLPSLAPGSFRAPEGPPFPTDRTEYPQYYREYPRLGHAAEKKAQVKELRQEASMQGLEYADETLGDDSSESLESPGTPGSNEFIGGRPLQGSYFPGLSFDPNELSRSREEGAKRRNRALGEEYFQSPPEPQQAPTPEGSSSPISQSSPSTGRFPSTTEGVADAQNLRVLRVHFSSELPVMIESRGTIEPGSGFDSQFHPDKSEFITGRNDLNPEHWKTNTESIQERGSGPSRGGCGIPFGRPEPEIEEENESPPIPPESPEPENTSGHRRILVPWHNRAYLPWTHWNCCYPLRQPQEGESGEIEKCKRRNRRSRVKCDREGCDHEQCPTCERPFWVEPLDRPPVQRNSSRPDEEEHRVDFVPEQRWPPVKGQGKGWRLSKK